MPRRKAKKKPKKKKVTLVKIALIVLAVVFIISFSGLWLLFESLTSPTPSMPTISKKVAVVQIKEDIGSGSATADEVIHLLNLAEEDPRVAAVLLDINSGGGTPVATREIGEKIKKLKNVKPVVVWIGESGTSGAYWIATCANLTMADPLSLVGSIGVIMEIPDVQGLMDKLGIKMVVIKQGKYKDLGSPFRNMTKEEEQILNELAGQLQQAFLEEIKNNRNMTDEQIQQFADGKFFLGERAAELGLIDRTGTKEDAIEAAAELAGIKPDWFYLREETFEKFLERIIPQQPSWVPV